MLKKYEEVFRREFNFNMFIFGLVGYISELFFINYGKHMLIKAEYKIGDISYKEYYFDKRYLSYHDEKKYYYCNLHLNKNIVKLPFISDYDDIINFIVETNKIMKPKYIYKFVDTSNENHFGLIATESELKL